MRNGCLDLLVRAPLNREVLDQLLHLFGAVAQSRVADGADETRLAVPEGSRELHDSVPKQGASARRRVRHLALNGAKLQEVAEEKPQTGHGVRLDAGQELKHDPEVGSRHEGDLIEQERLHFSQPVLDGPVAACRQQTFRLVLGVQSKWHVLATKPKEGMVGHTTCRLGRRAGGRKHYHVSVRRVPLREEGAWLPQER